MKEVLKKLRSYEIKIRKVVNSQGIGEFASLFKGTGLEFDDVRLYQYGDDIRTIDWNVSAKGHGTYVKTFKEERDQRVFFIADVSASQQIGVPQQQKIDIIKELTGVLSLSAVRLGSQVGLLAFSDQKEKYIKPNKGERHAHQIITELFKLQPKSTKTSLKAGFKQTLGVCKQRSIVIILSDFIDEGYEKELKSLGQKHDVIAIHVHSPLETKLPRLGIIPLFDKETKKTTWINSSFWGNRNKRTKQFEQNREQLQELCKKHQIDYLSINTQEDYVNQLISLFKKRNKTWKRNA
ncbi:MAG: DUF58 domain-containing protein [Cytophagales bacterium]|nr:DUF58 domain-containing protein [Cytophagales bacterium]